MLKSLLNAGSPKPITKAVLTSAPACLPREQSRALPGEPEVMLPELLFVKPFEGEAAGLASAHCHSGHAQGAAPWRCVKCADKSCVKTTLGRAGKAPSACEHQRPTRARRDARSGAGEAGGHPWLWQGGHAVLGVSQQRAVHPTITI